MSWKNEIKKDEKIDSIREPMVPKVALGDLMGEVIELVQLIEERRMSRLLPHAQRIRDEIELLKRSGL